MVTPVKSPFSELQGMRGAAKPVSTPMERNPFAAARRGHAFLARGLHASIAGSGE